MKKMPIKAEKKVSAVEQSEEFSDEKNHKKTRTTRIFPALPYEDCLSIADAIWRYASGQRIRRLTLFDQIGKAPESGTSRILITSSNKYGIVTGTTQSEYIELTANGLAATSEDSTLSDKAQANFELAIKSNEYFYKLYDQYKEMKVPSRQVLMDYLHELGLDIENQQKCVDLFLVNAKFIGLIKVLSGSERIISIEHLIEDLSSACIVSTPEHKLLPATPKTELVQPIAVKNENISIPNIVTQSLPNSLDWNKICFYISPIGEDDSEQRKHSDLFMGSIVEPALDDLGFKVVRADSIETAGTITAQIIEYIVKSAIVVADLSFHNPNVFYELSLRHTLGKPIIHIIRKCDSIPFDLYSFRTIIIDTSSIYTLVPQIESYRTSVIAQARQLLDNPGTSDNPITAFLEKIKKDK